MCNKLKYLHDVNRKDLCEKYLWMGIISNGNNVSRNMIGAALTRKVVKN